jgi:hypothetical protein
MLRCALSATPAMGAIAAKPSTLTEPICMQSSPFLYNQGYSIKLCSSVQPIVYDAPLA